MNVSSITSPSHHSSNAYKDWTYRTRPEFLSTQDRVHLAYNRARAAASTWGLTADDIANCSRRFWEMQRDGIVPLDIGVGNLLACHFNLFIGTMVQILERRPDLRPIVESALRCEVFGQMLLTEVGHGLDIINMETSATKVSDGFILHTPCPEAAKFMPPTTAIPGCAKMAVVFARLIIEGRDHGIHPFLVTLCTERGMCKGVQSALLPPRAGTSPLDYAITTFDHVHLPHSSFLGVAVTKPDDPKSLLFHYMWRVTVGVMAIACTSVTALKLIAVIGSDFSFRRHVLGNGNRKVPVITFRTQQLPVLYATAVAYVTDAWLPHAVRDFMSSELSTEVRHGVAITFKTTVIRFAIMLSQLVAERLGAQGTFGHNLLAQFEVDARGAGIAEGDILVCSIRLFSEVLLGRYKLPPPTHPDTLLSQHSTGIIKRCRELLSGFADGHRSDSFNNLILPQCEPGVTAMGHALSYSYALDAQVPQPLLDLFECYVIRLDPLWYAENVGLTDASLREKEDRAVREALPHLQEYVDTLNVRKWVTAPVTSDENWDQWVGQLSVQQGMEPQHEALFSQENRVRESARL